MKKCTLLDIDPGQIFSFVFGYDPNVKYRLNRRTSDNQFEVSSVDDPDNYFFVNPYSFIQL